MRRLAFTFDSGGQAPPDHQRPNNARKIPENPKKASAHTGATGGMVLGAAGLTAGLG